MNKATIVLDAYAGWIHNFLDENEVEASFLNAGGNSFTVSSGIGEDDGVSFGAGLTAKPNDSLSMFLRYDGEIAEDIDGHAVSAGLTLGF